MNGNENIDPTIFFKIKAGKITGGHDFTIGWILESIIFPRGR